MWRLLLLTLLSIPASANDIIESIEKFTNIFGISFSQNNGNTVATLDANYYLSDEFRVFGDIDTDLSWEVGTGYSIYSGMTYYTENTIKISEHKISTGIFGAKILHEDWTLIGDIHYNHKLSTESCLNEWCWENQRANTFEYSAGFIWSPVNQIDWIYKFNQELSTKNNRYVLPNIPVEGTKTNFRYHELVAAFNLSYLRPSITYTHFEDREDSIEFGLSFDF
ncbi:hypothetical protein [Vibrio sp. HN007]|uniref:hypothetical protein n=1 Tax=Vibrio iocasae TaxID=3098914 RepID=UPI0035D46970